MLEPFGELDHPGVQRPRRQEAEQLTGQGDVGEAVADVADTEPARALGLDLLATDRTPETPGHLLDRDGTAAGNIDRPPGGRSLQRKAERPGHVVHADEV